MKINIHLYITALILLINVQLSLAVPADPTPRKITQPDGSIITVRLRGDEHNHFFATLDGYALIENAKGYMTYATQATDGSLISTEVIASEISNRSEIEISTIKNIKISSTALSRAKARSRALTSDTTSVIKKAYPLTGTPKSLVILVNFSDKSFVTPSPKTAFTNLLNQAGYSTNGGTGSARDYFRDNSMGVFTPQFDVYGPYTLPNTMSYYGTNDASGNDKNPQQMVIDACTLAYNNGVDFSSYDTDKDGILDNVFVYYAGYNEAEGAAATTIWPHRWSLNNHSTRFNGVSVYGYACTSELKGTSGSNMCGIGTFCHEFGHVLGLDDLYNTTNNNAHTVSDWDIMDSGPYLNSGRTPPAYSAYERYIMKWLTPIDLTQAGTYRLDTLTTSNKAYILSSTTNRSTYNANDKTDPEYFIIENRQKNGWDKFLPGHGMLITHIFYNESNWENNTPNDMPTAMDVDIVEADGIGSDGSMSGDPYPGTSSVTVFNPKLRSGVSMNKPIYRIKENSGVIQFAYIEAGPLVSATKPTTFSSSYKKPSAAKTITITGEDLIDNIRVSITNNDYFELTTDSTSGNWSKSLTLTPANYKSFSQSVYLRFNPLYISYNGILSDSIKVESTKAITDIVPISGELTTEKITTIVNPDGTLTIITPLKKQTIYIYNTLGQLIRTIEPTANAVNVSDLSRKQVYIISSGGYSTKAIF